MNGRNLFWLIFMGMTILSCRKNKDGSPPRISITNPVNNTTWSIPVTLNVMGSVTDDKQLESVNVHVKSSTGNTVFDETRMLTGTQQDFLIPVPLTDLYLPGGIYEVKISASDGFNTSSKYINIHVNDVPRVLTHVYALTSSGAFQKTLNEINGSVFNSLLILNGDYTSCFTDNRNQQIGIAGTDSGAIEVYDPALNLQFSETNPGAPGFSFSAISTYDRWIYGASNGTVKSLLSSGQSYSTIQLQSNYEPEFIYEWSSVLCVSERQIVGSNHYLRFYSRNASAPIRSVLTNKEVKGMFPLSSSSFLIFANSSSGAEISVYDYSSDNSTPSLSIGGGFFRKIIAVSTSEFIVAHDLGIYYYSSTSNTATNMIPGLIANDIAFDDEASVLYVAGGNSVLGYAVPSGAQITVLNAGGTVHSVSLLFNK